MTNLPNSAVSVETTKESTATWWNKPLWGDKSAVQTITTAIIRKDIPPQDLDLYNKYLSNIRPLSAILKTLDNVHFKNPEFILYLEINNKLKNNIDEFNELHPLVELFRVALQTKNIFLRIDATESRYCSITQQKLYKFVGTLLTSNLSNNEFIEKLKEKVVELEPSIKTEEGKNALLSYSKELENLAEEEELGLKLLGLFKKESLRDLSILKKIGEIVNSLKNKNLEDLDLLRSIVETHEQLFVKLGTIIGVPSEKNNLQTYAIMLQYISLSKKYYHVYLRFERFSGILLSLEKRYLLLFDIRQKYPLIRYKQPKIFRTEIPGLSIYQKYQDLVNKNTIKQFELEDNSL